VQVEFSKQFLRSLNKLSKNGVFDIEFINSLIDDFLATPDKNSFDNKLIKNCSRYKNMWQIRVNLQYRILYLKFEDYLEFRHIDTHNKIDKLIKNC